MDDVERAWRTMSASLAVPAHLLRADQYFSMRASEVTLKEVQRRADGYLDEFRRAVLGLPPKSAVDRLAELVGDDDGA